MVHWQNEILQSSDNEVFGTALINLFNEIAHIKFESDEKNHDEQKNEYFYKTIGNDQLVNNYDYNATLGITNVPKNFSDLCYGCPLIFKDTLIEKLVETNGISIREVQNNINYLISRAVIMWLGDKNNPLICISSLLLKSYIKSAKQKYLSSLSYKSIGWKNVVAIIKNIINKLEFLKKKRKIIYGPRGGVEIASLKIIEFENMHANDNCIFNSPNIKIAEIHLSIFPDCIKSQYPKNKDLILDLLSFLHRTDIIYSTTTKYYLYHPYAPVLLYSFKNSMRSSKKHSNSKNKRGR